MPKQQLDLLEGHAPLGLLLDSRGVDVPMADNLTLIISPP